MEIVLDSQYLKSVVNLSGKTKFDVAMEKGRLKLGMDDDGGIEGEWSKTFGNYEFIKQLIIHWDSINGIKPIKTKKLPNHNVFFKKLRQLGYKNKDIDNLLLKTAYQLADRTVVSKDSDFWNPKDKRNRSKGNKNAPVAKYCRDNLGIIIMLLPALYKKIN